LHGLSDDYSIWLRRTRIEEYAAQYPLAIVMPDGFRTAYTNAVNGPQAATYMTQDLIGAVERHFNVKSSRNARAIGGLSMGGYGALRLALGYPDLFCSANSHSGALLWGTLPVTKTRTGTMIPEFELVFGKNPKGSEHDLIALADKRKADGKLPKLRIDCGVDDFLIEQNRTYVAKLKELGVPHEYDEYPGVHNWEYWDVHVREALRFHAKNLRLKA
jgi:putative tributyrin esterase